MELYDKILFGVFALGAEAFHLAAGSPMTAQVDGRTHRLGSGPLETMTLQRLLYDLCSFEALNVFEKRGAVTFDLNFEMGRRFRAFVLNRGGRVEMALKQIHHDAPPAERLGVPPGFIDLASEGWGLFVMASPENEGIGNTTDSVIKSLRHRTIERVIEIKDRRRFLTKHFGGQLYPAHENLGDAAVFLLARSPGSVLVTQARELELVRAALFAAESGHMAFLKVTAPRTDAALETISAMLDEADDPENLHARLAENLHAVLAQRLLRRKGHRHARVSAWELLARSDSLENVVRRREWDRVEHLIAAGRREGMIDQDDSLLGLVMRGRLLPATAIARARHPGRLTERIRAWREGKG